MTSEVREWLERHGLRSVDIHFNAMIVAAMFQFAW